MIRGYAYRRRRAAFVKGALALVLGAVLFTPKADGLRLPELGSFGFAPFVTDVQASETQVP